MKFISSFLSVTISIAMFASVSFATDAQGTQQAVSYEKTSVPQTPSSESDNDDDVPHKGGGRR